MDWTRFAALPVPKAVLLSDDDWRRDYGLSIAPYADYVLANGRDSAAAYRSKFVPFQWGVRPSLYWDGDNADRPVELAFVGQAYGDRPYLVDKLRRVGLQVAARGLGWQEGTADTGFIPRLLAQSRVGLNFNKNSRDGGLQIKARNFELAAAGCAPLLEYAPGLEDYFTHREDALFWSIERELIDGAIELISNPGFARQIGRAARARALAEHTYARRFEPLWERLTR
jgi:spore maturation protein CgeB